MKHKQNQLSPATYRTLIIILFALLLLLIGYVIAVHLELKTSEYGNQHNTNQLLNTTAELRFCYDNEIKPCDSISIQQWNSAHPENTFTRVTSSAK